MVQPAPIQPAQIVPPLRPMRGRLVLAAVAGFAVGSGVLATLWTLSTLDSGAVADARAACAALERVGDLPADGEGFVRATTLPTGTLERLDAARSLAEAAAAASENYRALAGHVDSVHSMVMSLNFGDPAGRVHLLEARRLCSLS